MRCIDEPDTGFRAFASAEPVGGGEWHPELESGIRGRLPVLFEHEGASLPQRDRLFAMVRDCLTKRAYWSAISSLARQPKVAGSLMAFALKREPLLAVMPRSTTC